MPQLATVRERPPRLGGAPSAVRAEYRVVLGTERGAWRPVTRR